MLAQPGPPTLLAVAFLFSVRADARSLALLATVLSLVMLTDFRPTAVFTTTLVLPMLADTSPPTLLADTPDNRERKQRQYP